jgi:excisionase family DNA binding protein
MSSSPTVRYLSAEEAAAYCRVSTKTVQRWLAAGTLKADKSGRAYRIAEHDLEPFRRHATADTPDTRQQRTSSTGDATPTIADTEAPYLAALVRELQAQLVQTAAAAAMWQERCTVLQAQLERPALPAPTSAQADTEPAQTIAEVPRPWYARLAAWWRR